MECGISNGKDVKTVVIMMPITKVAEFREPISFGIPWFGIGHFSVARKEDDAWYRRKDQKGQSVPPVTGQCCLLKKLVDRVTGDMYSVM